RQIAVALHEAGASQELAIAACSVEVIAVAILPLASGIPVGQWTGQNRNPRQAAMRIAVSDEVPGGGPILDADIETAAWLQQIKRVAQSSQLEFSRIAFLTGGHPF